MKKLLLSFLLLLYSSFGFSQFFENFENTTGISGPLPATWSLGSGNWTVFEDNFPNVSSGSLQRWGINAFAFGLAYQGTNCASVSSEQIVAGNISEDYLVTPEVTLYSTGGRCELRFFTRMFTAGNQGTIYKIMIAPSIGPPSDPTAYALVEEWTEEDLLPSSNFDVWTEKIVDLSAYANIGLGVRIAFVRSYTSSDGSLDGDRWLIDNVGISGTIDCNLFGSAVSSSPTTIDLTINTNNGNSVEVMILPCDAPAPAPMDSGIAVTGINYQFTNLIPNTCYKVYIKDACTVEWQDVNINYNYAPIRFIAFVDSNNNGIMESGENYSYYGQFTITENASGIVRNVYSNSYAFIPYLTGTSYNFSFQNGPYYNPCLSPTISNYNNIQPSSQIQTFYIPVVPVQNCFDNRLTLSHVTFPVPNTIDIDYLTITASSAIAPESGIITYTKAPNISIFSVTPSTGVVFTPTGFTCNYSGLTPSNRILLIIKNNIPPIPTVNLGDVLTSSASISFTPDDSIPSNNNASLSQTVLSSFDPNDINESHGPKIQFDQFNQNDYLTYTIRFQNTGNANAIRVLVNHILDSRIDETSISMIDARHDYIMVRRENTVSWEFNNIQLPPASVNEDLSNGFITFRVKLKPGFAIGDIIPATASIYFDSNPAIVTETFNTEFVQLLGNAAFDRDSISLYPNPAKSTVQITQTGNEDIKQVVFYDVAGKLVKGISNIISQSPIDISNLEKGIYFVEITTSSDIKAIRKLIIQ